MLEIYSYTLMQGRRHWYGWSCFNRTTLSDWSGLTGPLQTRLCRHCNVHFYAKLFNTLFYQNVLRVIRIIRIKPIIRNTFFAGKLH